MWCHAFGFGGFRGLGGWMFSSHLIGLFLVLIGIFFVFRHFSRHSTMYMHSNSGLQILEERYAKGEISREEYLEKRDTMLKK